MGRFDHAADLAGCPVAEIIERLRGTYGPVSYKTTPLELEAARRLEAMAELIQVLDASMKALAGAIERVGAEVRDAKT